jgi:hypothetical protein
MVKFPPEKDHDLTVAGIASARKSHIPISFPGLGKGVVSERYATQRCGIRAIEGEYVHGKPIGRSLSFALIVLIAFVAFMALVWFRGLDTNLLEHLRIMREFRVAHRQFVCA